jgi:hypothetical protein
MNHVNRFQGTSFEHSKIFADKNKMNQMLRCFLLYALKFTPESGDMAINIWFIRKFSDNDDVKKEHIFGTKTGDQPVDVSVIYNACSNSEYVRVLPVVEGTKEVVRAADYGKMESISSSSVISRIEIQYSPTNIAASHPSSANEVADSTNLYLRKEKNFNATQFLKTLLNTASISSLNVNVANSLGFWSKMQYIV